MAYNGRTCYANAERTTLSSWRKRALLTRRRPVERRRCVGSRCCDDVAGVVSVELSSRCQSAAAGPTSSLKTLADDLRTNDRHDGLATYCDVSWTCRQQQPTTPSAVLHCNKTWNVTARTRIQADALKFTTEL